MMSLRTSSLKRNLVPLFVRNHEIIVDTIIFLQQRSHQLVKFCDRVIAVWDRSGEYSPWGQSIFYPHGTHPIPRRMTRYWSFKFLSPLFEKWNLTGSFFGCWHLWKICPKGQNFVGFFKKKSDAPPPPPADLKPVILREGVWIKNGMSPEQKCKWPIKVELEHKTLARVTFIFSDSHKKFFLVFLQMIYYILSPWKM